MRQSQLGGRLSASVLERILVLGLWWRKGRVGRDAFTSVYGRSGRASTGAPKADANETVGDPAYPFKLFCRVITVSLETMKIVRSLPALDILEPPPPRYGGRIDGCRDRRSARTGPQNLSGPPRLAQLNWTRRCGWIFGFIVGRLFET